MSTESKRLSPRGAGRAAPAGAEGRRGRPSEAIPLVPPARDAIAPAPRTDADVRSAAGAAAAFVEGARAAPPRGGRGAPPATGMDTWRREEHRPPIGAPAPRRGLAAGGDCRAGGDRGAGRQRVAAHPAGRPPRRIDVAPRAPRGEERHALAPAQIRADGRGIARRGSARGAVARDRGGVRARRCDQSERHEQQPESPHTRSPPLVTAAAAPRCCLRTPLPSSPRRAIPQRGGGSMPSYFRKSVRAGPFRFNFSSGGVSASVGVKGLRVGTGPPDTTSTRVAAASTTARRSGGQASARTRGGRPPPTLSRPSRPPRTA